MENIIEKQTAKILDKLMQNKIIDFENKDIYAFGITQLMYLLIYAVSILTIALIFDAFFELLVFSISLVFLRSKSGGAHVDNIVGCFAATMLQVFIVLLLVKYTAVGDIVMISIGVIANIIISIYAPVDNANKRLDDDEKKKYKKQTIIILFILDAFFAGFLLLDLSVLAYAVLLAQIVAVVSLIIGLSANKRTKDNSNTVKIDNI